MQEYNLTRVQDLEFLNHWISPSEFQIGKRNSLFLLQKGEQIIHKFSKKETTKIQILDAIIKYSKGKKLKFNT